MMKEGKVKWFNNAKGYGFINAKVNGKNPEKDEYGGDDLLVHFSTIEMDGYKTVKAGQKVSFDIIEGPKGQHAVNIRAVKDDQESPAKDTQTARQQERIPVDI
ncbi:Cold-shock protein, DNA-binding [Pseudomonas cannabina]|uniref:Cold-shock protein, DNA-binding n=2 Tax=Pseudomonas cannabina TaxID=86840 RepID=A0A0P9NDX5_PSECA|nr:Cold-shock protein, DNA-binding [Pseudomonas cannabina]RMN18191.1 Cold-shock protein, DNA-binding [Pseudomonas cannabina]